MIYFDRVTKIYPDSSRALDQVTLAITPGEFMSVIPEPAKPPF